MSINVIFRENNERLFVTYWKEIADQKRASVRYLPATLEYQRAYFKSALHLDKSFIYVVNKKPVACAFLPMEKDKNEISLSLGREYIISPLCLDNAYQKQIFTLIDKIAKDNCVSRIMFSLDPLNEEGYNYLQKYGYIDTSILSYIIDLSVSEDLLGACRKNTRNDIKKITRDTDFQIFFIDNKNPSYKIHEEYRILHHKCSGRITRSKESFDLQFKKLLDGNAVLFGLRYKGKNIAYSYFEHSFDKALYASSADDPEYQSLPLYHSLVFFAMEYLKKKGVRYIDTSQPSNMSAQIGYYPNRKQLNIAFFKRGFGGDFRMNFRGIKYFSEESFKSDMAEFTKNYTTYIQ